MTIFQGRDGELRLYEYGLPLTEKITNGSFASDTSWTKGTGWAIANGVATHSGVTKGDLTQALSILASEKYTVIFTVSTVTAAGAGVCPELGGKSGTTRTTAATFTEHITTNTTGSLKLRGGANFHGDIDDVSVKQTRGGTTYYLEALFCGMDFSGPVKRGKVTETLILNRDKVDSKAHYIKGSDEECYGVLPISFTARLADTVNSRVLNDWLSGVTASIGGGTTTIAPWPSDHTIFRSTSGVSVSLPSDAQKPTYMVEILWDGTTDYGLRYDNVNFKPQETAISEAADNLTIAAAGDVYGDVSRITSFYSGASIVAWA